MVQLTQFKWKEGIDMELMSVVRSEPGQYYAEVGAVKVLADKLAIFQRPVVMTGEKSYAAFVKHYGSELNYPILRYDRSASHENMIELAETAKNLNADVIVGIGGGKVLDTAKGTADILTIDTVLIPTVAGTCACSTPVAAVYHPNHSFKTVDYYQRAGFLTLVDYQLLVESPREYTIGGICDTLAKWYEAEGINRNSDPHTLPAMVQLGLASAKVSQQILLHDTKMALEAVDTGVVNDAFQRVVDTVFAISAYVGCQACEYGRMAGAHAFHNGLTLLKETNAIQHGVKVAYGILIQLCVTGDEEEVRRLIPFYKENGFIYSWEQLGVSAPFETAALLVAEFAASPNESFKLVKENITAEEILTAIRRVEELVQEVL